MRLTGWPLLLDMLACYRLTILAAEDEISAPLRSWITRRSAWAGRGVECPFCVSVWVGFGIVLWERAWPEPWSYLALGLALSAVASGLAVILGRVAE